MSDLDAQSQASSTWTTEDRKIAIETNPGREGGTGEKDGRDGDFDLGIPGTSSEGRTTTLNNALTGKIIDQLIADRLDRLEKARACIKWYQDEEEQELKQLQNLYQLREIERQQNNTEKSQSE